MTLNWTCCNHTNIRSDVSGVSGVSGVVKVFVIASGLIKGESFRSLLVY